MPTAAATPSSLCFIPRHVVYISHIYRCFDGFRWYRQRQQGQQSSDEDSGGKWQFVTPDPNYLTFGSGKYVCPGRFIADHMIKLMMVAVLSCYEVKRAPGAPKPTQSYLHVFSFPDQPTLLMKRRVGADQLQIL